MQITAVHREEKEMEPRTAGNCESVECKRKAGLHSLICMVYLCKITAVTVHNMIKDLDNMKYGGWTDMRRLALWCTVLLCVLCLCLAGASQAEGIPQAQELALDTSCEVSVSTEEEAYVCFTAESSGLYTLSRDVGGDIRITVYKASGEELIALFSNSNEVTVPLQTGESRYFGVRFDDDYTGNFSVSISQLGSLVTLNESEQNTVPVEGNKITYVMFVPQEAGRYCFYSTSNEDTYVYVYSLTNGQLYETGSDDDSGENNNFSVTVSANAGEPLYFGVRYYSIPTGYSFPVIIEPYNGLVSYVTGEQIVNQVYGQASTLTVEASSGHGEVTWTWLIKEDGLYVPVDGTNGNSITVPADITEATEYRCLVSDGTEQQQHDFTVYPTDELTEVHAQDDNISISLGGSADLSVVAVTASNLHTYQWYQEKQTEDNDGNQIDYFEPVPDAVNNTYHVEGIEKNTRYKCRVASPLISSCQDVEFYVSVSCDMNVAADGDQEIWVAAGDSAEMRVLTETDSNLVTYQWYIVNKYGDWERIDGAETDTYIVTDIQRNSSFRCTIDNGYDVSESIEFTVYIENGVQAWAVNQEVTVDQAGEDCLLEAGASSDDGSSIFSYQWYGPSDSENGQAEAITGATEASYTVSDIQHNAYYYCIVTDQNAFCDRIDFTVVVSNGFYTEPAIDQWQYIAVGETVDLGVNAYCSNGEISYKWYGPITEGQTAEEADAINGATDAFYPVTKWTSSHDIYLCVISDQYGNSKTVGFDVFISSDLDAHAFGYNNYLYIGYDQNTTLSVEATSSGTISCEWYQCVLINDYVSGWRRIEGETGTDLFIEHIAKPTDYRCRVSDQTGGECFIEFHVYIANDLQVSCGEQGLSVKANEQAVLNVTASCIGGEISYQWYAEVRDNYGNSTYRVIEGETASTLVVSDHAFNNRGFYCLVTDETGNAVQSDSFYICVDNGFSAEAGESGLTVTPGGSITMTVYTTSYDGIITYTWYLDNTVIPEATGSSYTIEAANRCANYRCYVRDRYNNDTNIYYTICIENELTAFAVEESQAVIPGQNAVMTVQASCDIGSLSYQWSKNGIETDEWGNEYEAWIPVEGATAETYTSEAITDYTQYRCSVYDEYGNSTSVDFHVYIENHFTAEAVQSNIPVAYGETVCMEVIASCDVGNLTYEWYKEEYTDAEGNWHGTELIEGETGSTYTSEAITRYTEYYCHVQDKYGNDDNVWFCLCPHENIRDVIDESYTEYEWISNTQHTEITVVISHRQCDQCGYCEPPVTTVTEGEPGNHVDADENGICDICAQSIEGSFLWDVNGGNLRITGNGVIPGFEQVSDLPWYNDLGIIERVFIEGDFTAIGENVLNGLKSETRIDFRQRKMPTTDTTTISGVCRYYSTDESWKNAPESWIYLPIFNPDWESLNQVEYHEGIGWETGRYEATGNVSYPLNTKQAVELAYTGRNVFLYGIPTGDDLKVITDHWDTTWAVLFQEDCVGTMNLEIGRDAQYGLCFDVYAPNLTLNIDGSNIESINRILVSAGNVTFTGRIRNVCLRGGSPGYSTVTSLTVNGDVDVLDFYESPSDAPYFGSLTVNGTIASGSVYGSGTISIPNISDAVVFPNMVKAAMTNVQQTTPVVTNGVLTVDGVQPISGLTYEDFNLRYHLYSDGWRLDLRPKMDSPYGQYGADIDDVEAYNPEFSTDDILWGETTEVYVWRVRDMGKLVFNGGENGEGLGELTLYSCIAEVNCPVTTLRVNQSYTDSDPTTVTINGEITTLSMEMRKNGNSVYLGEGGSVGGGYWNRYFGEYRYFGPITEAGDIYSEGQLKVLSWKDGQSIRALLPSDIAVTEAAGQAATIDLNEVTENTLSDGEYDKLQEYLQDQGIGTIAGVFDVSVMGVDANGNIQEGVKISTLNSDVPLTVSNEANGEAYILRLHKNDDGTVSADQLCDVTDSEELTFASNLFSKYVIIDANGMPETGEVSWQIAKQRLIISGNGPMEDYEKPEDAPWYEQREEIKEIILDSGITRVGANAFCDMTDTVRVDFNQRVLPSMGENAFGSSNVICRYYREHSSWTGTYGANSIKWIYLPINNQGSDLENIHYYKDSETFGTGWTVYSEETGEIAVSTEQAEELSFLSRAVYLYAVPENQADIDVFEQHWDIMYSLYFFPEGSGTYSITLPETARPFPLSFDAPGWTLNFDATALGNVAFGIWAGGGTLNVTAEYINNLTLGSQNVYVDPIPEGRITVYSNVVETLNFYNSDNGEYVFAGDATIYGTVKNGYEYGTATAVIPNIPNITAPQMIVSRFENVNQTDPVVLNGELNVADAESYGVYTTDNSWLFYQLYDNEGEDYWKLQISPRTNDNSQPVIIEIADYNPDFTIDDICWGKYTGLTLTKARPGQTVVINGADGKGLNCIFIEETDVEINCPVDQLDIGDWNRNGNNFQVTVKNTIGSVFLNMGWKHCSILLNENAQIHGGYLKQPFYEDLYFEDVCGNGIMMQNGRLMILSHQEGQRISTLLPDEETLTDKAGLGSGQIAIMEATDADGLTEAEAVAFARANIQGTTAEAFDVSVAVYEVDEEGNAGGRIGSVTTLNGEVPIMVQNVTGEEAFVVRLHEDENGEITAEAVMEEASDANVFTFYSDLFSKYVLVKAEKPIDLSTLTILQLPAGLKRIEDNAFEGGVFQAVIIPDGCLSIGTDAFKDCPHLIYVSYPAGLAGIEDAFTGCNIRKMDERQ